LGQRFLMCINSFYYSKQHLISSTWCSCGNS